MHHSHEFIFFKREKLLILYFRNKLCEFIGTSFKAASYTMLLHSTRPKKGPFLVKGGNFFFGSQPYFFLRHLFFLPSP